MEVKTKTKGSISVQLFYQSTENAINPVSVIKESIRYFIKAELLNAATAKDTREPTKL